MPVRYTTQTTVNFDKYNTYSRIVDPDRTKNRIIDCCAAVFAAAIAVMMAMRGNYPAAAFAAVFAIAAYPMIQFWQKRRLKKFYDMTHKKNPEENYIYRFFDDEVEIVTSGVNIRFKYDQLQKVYETKNCFYLMIGESEGYIIEKAGCKEGLIELLHGLVK